MIDIWAKFIREPIIFTVHAGKNKLWSSSTPPWDGNLNLRFNLDLAYTTSTYADSILFHIWHDKHGRYEICFDLDFRPPECKLLDPTEAPSFDNIPVIPHPTLSGGVSRLSVWVQYFNASGFRRRVIGNNSLYLWDSHADAAVELRNRLQTCLDKSCEAVIRSHLNLAETRHREVVASSMALEADTDLRRRTIEVATTVFARHKQGRGEKVEGTWITPLALRHKDVLFSVDSATALTKDLSFAEVQAMHGLEDAPTNVDVRPAANPGNAHECPGVLTYLIEHYENLPALMVR
jgi:hypothetical protein